MTPGEFYTTQFYSWECRGRGWYVSDYPVQLEPPFIPYFRQGFPKDRFDDGKRHTLVSRFLENLNGKNKSNTGDQNLLDYETIEPFEYKTEIHLRTLQVKLSKDRKITPERMKALLIMLSYINTPVSFEIIGTESEIIIQFVCDEVFIDTLETYINAYFPQCAVIQSNAYLETILQEHLSTAVVDFGLTHEFIRPLNTSKNFSIDPLIGFLGVLDKLGADEQAGMQILFQPALNQWSDSIIRSVTMYDGTSFFTDAPEAPLLAKEKVQSPLYGVSIRTFAQAIELTQAFTLLERISFTIINGSKGNTNQLIPLSTQSYDFQTRVDDILLRESHRLGMLLNVDELISLVHFPSETINSKKLFTASRKTTETPAIAQGKAFILGENNHNGIKTTVSFGLEDRLKHSHIIGSTGTGKSTLIANLILQDIEQGFGVVLFDPHGDLVDDLLSLIPENRLKDVVFIDPADTDFPIGLNILQAKTDIEKEVLSSDLVTSFKKYATTWGDQMSTVLGNTILAILESTKGGTLHDVRRFLVEKEYRANFLKHITDPTVQYYWQKEFPLLKTNSIGPILTRLDTFLRPKSIRNMLVQKNGLDFEELLNDNKIILLKLSQGLIGIENSFLLGSLVLSKLHQAILRRQQDTNRNPIFLYLDEFQNFITPSIKDMISGIRKYNVGLTLSHQDLQQLQREDSELLNSILGNINNRIVFRVGEPDAKKLQDGFADFDYSDLQNLGRGEAIIRIEQPKYNCSLNTNSPKEKINGVWQNNIKIIVNHSREQYATTREKVEMLLFQSLNLELPVIIEKKKQESIKTEPVIYDQKSQPATPALKPIEPPKESKPTKPEKEVSSHRYLQTLTKKMAEARGYVAVLETQLPDGTGQVDVLLSKEGRTIAIEICVTTDADWEMHNIEKCLAANYDTVVSLCGDPKQLEKIRKKCSEGIPELGNREVYFFTPDVLFTFLDTAVKTQVAQEQIIKGYRVNVTYDEVTKEEMNRKRASIAKVVMDSLRKQKIK